MKFNFKDITGQTFGRLKVIKYHDTQKKHTRWLCKCSCGKERVIHSTNLRFGYTKSCGCLLRDMNKERSTHKETGTKTYRAWTNMKTRCYNKKCKRYKDWGGRGIKVCGRWKKSYLSFREDMGEAPLYKSIDRIDNSKDYCKKNCKWSTSSEQAFNRRKK